MKQFAKLMLLTLGFGMLAALTGLVGPQPKSTNAAVAAAVAVVNTPNVNVVNTPAVNANQSGPWNVGINGTPNVNIANTPTVSLAQGTTVGITGGNFSVNNTPTTPVFIQDVSDPVLQPIQFDLCVEAGDLAGSCAPRGQSGTFQVPFAAQVPFQFAPRNVERMVIDTVSALCVQHGGSVLALFFQTQTASNGSSAIYHYLALGPTQSGLSTMPVQTVRIYADHFTPVQLSAISAPGTTGSWCTVAVSAHLVTE